VNGVERFILSVKRRDQLATRWLHDLYRWLERWRVPQNRLSRALYQTLYYAHDAYQSTRELLLNRALFEPMVRARLHHVGARVQFNALPYLVGHTRISIGDDCTFHYFKVESGRFCDQPELSIGNRCYFANDVTFSVNARITLGNHVGCAGRTIISDSDNHPFSLERRLRDEQMSVGDIAPVRIDDYVWLGRSCQIMKGVTIGRGAVVAAGSVVVNDIPAGALAMGVPARFVRQPQ
jgi:acetyltransferase-like isoleucine patch superfamily enzyme